MNKEILEILQSILKDNDSINDKLSQVTKNMFDLIEAEYMLKVMTLVDTIDDLVNHLKLDEKNQDLSRIQIEIKEVKGLSYKLLVADIFLNDNKITNNKTKKINAILDSCSDGSIYKIEHQDFSIKFKLSDDSKSKIESEVLANMLTDEVKKTIDFVKLENSTEPSEIQKRKIKI